MPHVFFGKFADNALQYITKNFRDIIWDITHNKELQELQARGGELQYN